MSLLPLLCLVRLDNSHSVFPENVNKLCNLPGETRMRSMPSSWISGIMSQNNQLVFFASLVSLDRLFKCSGFSFVSYIRKTINLIWTKGGVFKVSWCILVKSLKRACWETTCNYCVHHDYLRLLLMVSWDCFYMCMCTCMHPAGWVHRASVQKQIQKGILRFGGEAFS